MDSIGTKGLLQGLFDEQCELFRGPACIIQSQMVKLLGTGILAGVMSQEFIP